MKSLMIAGPAIALAFTAAGCGTNQTDRAISGAALGAGTAAVGAALVDGKVGNAALVGGVLGLGAGFLVDPNTVDLGTPIWRQ